MTDAHIHIGRNCGRALASPVRETIGKLLEAYRRLGITKVRDCGDAFMCGLQAREIAADSGVTVETAVWALSKRGGYGGFLGRQVAGLSEIKSELNHLMQYKPDFIKLVQSGIVSFEEYGTVSGGGFDPAELRYLTDFAADAGLDVVVHCNGAGNVRMAVEAGAGFIEHGYFIGHGELEMMRDAGAVWTPTFVPLSNFLKSGSASDTQKLVISKTLELHSENLRTAISLGVRVAAGSDAGSAFVAHGQGLVDELECLYAAGMPKEYLQPMRSFTNPAQKS